MRNQIGIRQQHAWCVGVRLEYRHRLTGLNQQGLIVLQRPQRRYDCRIRIPVPRRLPPSAVNDEILGPFGDLRIETVHEHPQRSLLLPPLAA